MIPVQHPARRRPQLDPQSNTFIVLLAFVTAMQAIGTTFTLPALPSIATDFGSTPDRAQLTLSLYLGGLACGQILFGALSDRFGRRPVLLGSMMMFTLAGAGCALATDIRMLIAMRALQGFAGGAGMILGRAILRDLFERERALKAMSLLVGVMTMVPMLAPFLGGLVMGVTTWRGLFGILTLVSALLTACTWLLIDESIRHRDPRATDPRRILANLLEIVRRPDAISFPFVAAVIFGGFFAYLALIPFIAIETFGMSVSDAGWLGALNGVALWSGALTNNRLSGRWPVRRLLRFSTGLALAAGLTALAVSLALTFQLLGAAGHGMLGLMLLVVPTMAFSFTFGITQPNTIVMGLQPVPHIAGVASALGATLQMASAALFTWLAGLAYNGTPLALGVTLAAASIASFLVFTLVAAQYSPERTAAPR